MPRLKTRILRHMIIIFLLMSIILASLTIILLRNLEKQNARNEAEKMFTQIDKVLQINQHDIDNMELRLSASLLKNCDAVAYVLDKDPTIRETVESCKELAKMLQIDEINIFDESGKIIQGSEPDYFGFTMDSGEQIGYFKPMLTDKKLRLVQDAIPNTAKNITMQYAAIWDLSESFIIEVGINQTTISDYRQKNELSYVFQMLTPSSGVGLTAIDVKTNRVLGSTFDDTSGHPAEDLSYESVDQLINNKVLYTYYNGVHYYEITHKIDDIVIIYSIDYHTLYSSLVTNILLFFLVSLIVSTLFTLIIIIYLDKFVIKNIQTINNNLKEISEGNNTKAIDVSNSKEFHDLSIHINDMLDSILASQDKLGFVINKTNLRVCVYEYNTLVDFVQFSSYGSNFLPLTTEELRELTSDRYKFINYINNIKEHPYSYEEKIYQVNEHIYVRIEEYHDNKDSNNLFGIILDVTNDIASRLKIESERDIDVLTGILNRRSLHEKLNKLITGDTDLSHSAIIMIDVDNLKVVNDLYGHDDGDIYLQKLAEELKKFGTKYNVTARLGGDEFVVLLYGYDSDDELMNDLEELRKLQDNKIVELSDNQMVNLLFSMGYVKMTEDSDYHELLREADELMYQNKRERKKAKNG